MFMFQVICHMLSIVRYLLYRICRNKRPGRSIFRSIRKSFQKPSVLCTPPYEKLPIKSHWFCVLPPLKNHPSQPIGFVYSPLWKITHQRPHRFCILPPLKNHCFWWALISGWAFIPSSTVWYVHVVCCVSMEQSRSSRCQRHRLCSAKIKRRHDQNIRTGPHSPNCHMPHSPEKHFSRSWGFGMWAHDKCDRYLPLRAPRHPTERYFSPPPHVLEHYKKMIT